MADYTIDELQNMLAEKVLEQPTISTLDEYIDVVGNASDIETEKIQSNGIIVGHIFKSRTENKQFTEQRYYINETENDTIVGRAVSYRTYVTGSYSDSLTLPTLQVIGTRPKDRTVLKG